MVVIGGSTSWTLEEFSLIPDDTTVVKFVQRHVVDYIVYRCIGLTTVKSLHVCVNQSFMYFLKPRSGDLPQRSLLLVIPKKNIIHYMYVKLQNI